MSRNEGSPVRFRLWLAELVRLHHHTTSRLVVNCFIHEMPQVNI
ncbi:unnamed protein product [Spirodela intermedia]|uniref:Uncharacterized protein n=1 Tax=Spirodela intermedia TaxID=51605 RepID=A0A7I8JL31_SPIIN|nr:unnamed protein product [Spirodela intermedia]CAA6670303.1 unnamed protein product [Spirodela intermedia]